MHRLIFSILVLLAAFAANAQNLLIGASGVGNLSRFKFTENLESSYPDRAYVPGVGGGLRVGYNFTPSFGLISGVEYAPKGSEYSSNNYLYTASDGSQLVGYFEREERLNFLSIPLLARWQSGGEDGGFLLAAGFNFNIGWKGNIVDRFESPQLSAPITIRDEETSFGAELRDVYRSLQTGFVLAPGYMFRVGDRGRLTFNIGLDVGLSDSFNEKWKNFTNIIGEQLNRSLFLSIGYEYHFEGGGDNF
jgi:hypothetical protein